MSNTTELSSIEDVAHALKRVQPHLPGALKHRFQNTLEHFERSFNLLDIDKEMASFRAITGEEEAATTLMECIHFRKYKYSVAFNRRDHRHKAAVLTCVLAIGNTLRPMLKEFQLIFDFSKPRIDVKLPLSNFGVDGGEDYAIQFVEPLGIFHTKPGTEQSKVYDEALQNLASQSQFENIKKLVDSQANARNTLLYASDSRGPISLADRAAIENRRNRAFALLVITILIWQTTDRLPMVEQAILAFIGVMAKLPPENA